MNEEDDLINLDDGCINPRYYLISDSFRKKKLFYGMMLSGSLDGLRGIPVYHDHFISIIEYSPYLQGPYENDEIIKVRNSRYIDNPLKS